MYEINEMEGKPIYIGTLKNHEKGPIGWREKRIFFLKETSFL